LSCVVRSACLCWTDWWAAEWGEAKYKESGCSEAFYWETKVSVTPHETSKTWTSGGLWDCKVVSLIYWKIV